MSQEKEQFSNQDRLEEKISLIPTQRKLEVFLVMAQQPFPIKPSDLDPNALSELTFNCLSFKDQRTGALITITPEWVPADEERIPLNMDKVLLEAAYVGSIDGLKWKEYQKGKSEQTIKFFLDMAVAFKLTQ